MEDSNNRLLYGGICSILVSGLHIGLLFFMDNQTIMTFFGAPKVNGSNIVSHGEPLYIWAFLATLAIALIFFGFAMYAFSGAGKIKPLPGLKPVIIGIGIIYCLRGLMIFADGYNIFKDPYFSLIRNPDFIFSIFSTIAGYFYLADLLVGKSG